MLCTVFYSSYYIKFVYPSNPTLFLLRQNDNQTHGNHGDENRNTTNEKIPISSLCFPVYFAGVHKKGVKDLAVLLCERPFY